MPELPEVELFKRILSKKLLGETIVSLESFSEHIFDISLLKKFFLGKTIKQIKRRGKHLYFSFEETTFYLLSHLGMTGKYLFELSTPDQPFLRVKITFASGKTLYYIDIRQFGSFKTSKTLKEAFNSLGIEPLSKNLTYEKLKPFLKSSQVLKSWLLEQSIIAGLGNIYSDEALFTSGLHPLRKVNTLSKVEVILLIKAIKKTLTKALKTQATLPAYYENTLVLSGSKIPKFFVYGRTGQPCLICKTPISKLMYKKRGLHYCIICQK